MKFIAFLKWLVWLILGFFISGLIDILIDKSNLMTKLFGNLGTTIGAQINDIWWFLPLILLNLIVFHYAIGWWGAKAALAWLLLLPYLLYAVVSTIAQGITWNTTAVVYLIGALVVGLTEDTSSVVLCLQPSRKPGLVIQHLSSSQPSSSPHFTW